jgi:hypothetical protein
MKLYEAEGLGIQRPVLGNLIGWYSTEFGALNQVVHLWGYESFAERERRRAELFKRADWLTFFAKIRPLIVAQESKILTPAPWSPASRPPVS